MSYCNCEAGFGNTRTPKKQLLVNIAKGMFIVPKIADDGTVNKIPSGTIVDAAYITARVNDPDKSKRWYPLQGWKNVTDERADSIFETFTEGTRVKVSDGTRTFNGVIPFAGTIFLGNLEKLGECNDLGVFTLDECKDMIGTLGADGDLYPTCIESGTWDVNYVKGNGNDISAKVSLQFDIDRVEQDANLRVLKPASDVDVLKVEGLYTLLGDDLTGISTTGFTVTINTEYGAFDDSIKQEGLLLADFALYNETAAASVAISSVTESPAGTYTFAFAAQTPADVLTLTTVANGVELVPVSITIP